MDLETRVKKANKGLKAIRILLKKHPGQVWRVYDGLPALMMRCPPIYASEFRSTPGARERLRAHEPPRRELRRPIVAYLPPEKLEAYIEAEVQKRLLKAQWVEKITRE
jgi:hypothetical protein